jgi:hypothetical protein
MKCMILFQDVKLHYVEKGDKSKELMLLVHGFPEFWYSWRHQIKEFSKDYWWDILQNGNSILNITKIIIILLFTITVCDDRGSSSRKKSVMSLLVKNISYIAKNIVIRVAFSNVLIGALWSDKRASNKLR